MSRKLNFIPPIPNYRYVQTLMNADLQYRLKERTQYTSLGRPLYYRINVQLITTEECPYQCPFCLERQNPMEGNFDMEAQYKALKYVLKEHPNARLTITGGEPSLYPNHIKEIVKIYHENSNNIFCSINTSGYNKNINGLAHINLSINDFVRPNPNDFPNCTIQTVLKDSEMNINNLKSMMDSNDGFNFSFRFLTDINKNEYDVSILNELQNDREIHISTYRIGDFFMYATFNYKNHHARVTLGDMYQLKHNDYKDGYSNIIIHPDGTIGINWN